jgi:prepilin-type processing-associated H-X9-DG protein
VREAAARAQCQNNLKQVALALHSFHDVNRYFPVGTAEPHDLPAEKRLSWLATILPYLEQGPLFKQLDGKNGWDAKENCGPVSVSIYIYQCPAHPGTITTHTHYVGLAGIGADAPLLDKDQPNAGFFGYARRITHSDIKDGQSCTAAVIETESENGPWAAGGPFTVRSVAPEETLYVGDGGNFGLKHKTDTFFRSNPYIANTAFADGSVRSISPTVSPEVFRALITIAGREDVTPDF